MNKIKTIAISASAGIAAAILPIGLTIGTANATGFPTYSTSSRVETVVSPKCLHVHQVTKTGYHWSSTLHRYVPQNLHTTTTDYTTCHA